MKKTVIIYTVISLVLIVGELRAQSSVLHNKAVTEYIFAIKSARAGSDARALENAFSKVNVLRRALSEKQKNNLYLLESLSETEYRELKAVLPCVILSREETVYIRPNVNCFANIAKKRGSPADRLYFSAYEATYPNSVWPIYVQQQTDYSGCTAFGSGKLVEVYSVWNEFIKRHPRKYTSKAHTERNRVSRELAESTCACESKEETLNEFRNFLSRFPNIGFATEVEVRLRELEAGRESMRYKCISG